MRVEIEAFNTANESTNLIHDDEVARRYGFAGGLVPGVDVFAYLTQPAVHEWGPEWLARGSIAARFLRPVYDGERIAIVASEPDDDSMQLEARGSDDELRATAQARELAETDESGPPPEHRPLPEERPPADAASLAPGTILGSVEQTFDADAAQQYLEDVRETLPLYATERIAHPGWLLRCANTVLSANVRLGPWIHVSSDVRFHGLVLDGDTIETRALVTDEFERAGHRFVTLDVAVLGEDGALRQRVRHTAIHTPRQS